jgi:hypothetical protein
MLLVVWLTTALLAVVAHANHVPQWQQPIAFSTTTAAIGTRRRDYSNIEIENLLAHIVRGGGVGEAAVPLEDEDLNEEEKEEGEETLAASTMKKIERAKLSSVKKEVASTLAKTAKKKSKTSLYAAVVPYIVRASMNPFTLFAMVKAYWISLFDLDFLKKKEVAGQDLRSALEEKAKRSPYSGPSKRKRKMKPGQAKTLSDLPQLSS